MVWMDIPVEDLNRAVKFYSQLMDLKFVIQEHEGMKFSLCPHSDEMAAFCLVVEPGFSACDLKHDAPLVYLNVDGRIDQALKATLSNGGRILKAKEQIGPYGYRAVILDSEGNRIALHSMRA
jgi:predicted enzyme related to lactoylglutathione lyase